MTIRLDREEQKISNNINSYIRNYAEAMNLYFEICETCHAACIKVDTPSLPEFALVPTRRQPRA